MDRNHPDFRAGLLLAPDVDRAGGVFTDEDRCETGLATMLGGERGDLHGKLGADAGGDGLAVNDRC